MPFRVWQDAKEAVAAAAATRARAPKEKERNSVCLLTFRVPIDARARFFTAGVGVQEVICLFFSRPGDEGFCFLIRLIVFFSSGVMWLLEKNVVLGELFEIAVGG